MRGFAGKREKSEWISAGLIALAGACHFLPWLDIQQVIKGEGSTRPAWHLRGVDAGVLAKSSLIALIAAIVCILIVHWSAREPRARVAGHMLVFACLAASFVPQMMLFTKPAEMSQVDLWGFGSVIIGAIVVQRRIGLFLSLLLTVAAAVVTIALAHSAARDYIAQKNAPKE